MGRWVVDVFDAPCLLPCVVQYLALMNERLELAATATAVTQISV